MLEVIKPLFMQLEFNTNATIRVLEQTNLKQDLLGTPAGANPPLWQILHMTQSRSFFA